MVPNNLYLKVPNSEHAIDWYSWIAMALDYSNFFERTTIDFALINSLSTREYVLLACLLDNFYLKDNKFKCTVETMGLNYEMQTNGFSSLWSNDGEALRIKTSSDLSIVCLWKIENSLIPKYIDQIKIILTQHNCTSNDSDIVSCIEEVLFNVVEHSQSETSGYILTKYFKNTHELTFSVCDFGIGIPSSVQSSESFNISNYQDHITLEYILKCSPLEAKRIKPFGLQQLSKLIEVSGGELTITSNNGLLYKFSDAPIFTQETNYNFHGTLITATINTKPKSTTGFQ